MSKFEIMKIPSISTGHLTQHVAAKLTERRDSNPWTICAAYEYGYFLYVDDLGDLAPQCLKDIREWLMENHEPGWIRLDCDAPAVEGLPLYDW